MNWRKNCACAFSEYEKRYERMKGGKSVDVKMLGD